MQQSHFQHARNTELKCDFIETQSNLCTRLVQLDIHSSQPLPTLSTHASAFICKMKSSGTYRVKGAVPNGKV